MEKTVTNVSCRQAWSRHVAVFWSRAERDEGRQRARAVGAEICLHSLDVAIEELWARLEARNTNPDAIVVIPRHILEYWSRERFEAPTPEELDAFDEYG